MSFGPFPQSYKSLCIRSLWTIRHGFLRDASHTVVISNKSSTHNVWRWQYHDLVILL